MDKIAKVLDAYALDGKELRIRKFGSGHIHATYLVDIGTEQFILQRFNEQVFRFPERISGNLKLLSEHKGTANLSFALPLPLKNREGEFFTVYDKQLFRLFPFVEGVTKDAVEFPQEAQLAAEAFGTFINTFLDVPTEGLEESIPDFHNLTLRYQQLLDSIHTTKLTLDRELQTLVDFYTGQTELLDQYQDYQKTLPLRVTHNDTKINNLIFKEDLSRVNALIDLDTIMPGFIFYDFGDLVRTVACSEDESSQDWAIIQVDLDKYQGLIKGFCNPLKNSISREELASLGFGGEMMTYIMGLRFLADYLNGNIYYHINYPMQNFHRAKNQFLLLTSLKENRSKIREMMEEVRIEQEN